jgi:hypothetical protein
MGLRINHYSLDLADFALFSDLNIAFPSARILK